MLVPIMVVQINGGYCITLANQCNEVYTRECEYLLYKPLKSIDFNHSHYEKTMSDIISVNYPNAIEKMVNRNVFKPYEVFIEYKNVLIHTVIEFKLKDGNPELDLKSKAYNTGCVFVV